MLPLFPTQDHEAQLDAQIEALTESIKTMTDVPGNKAHLYVTDLDIIGLPCFCNDTIFAVNAPHGTTLSVPDPTENTKEGDKR